MSKTDLVKDFILEQVKAGKIKTGQRLPSCRDVAALLAVNKLTVNKAYNQLEQQHIVYSIPRGGFYLVEFEQMQKQPRQEADFQSVRPDPRLIPYREFTHVINKAIDMHKNSLFDYSDPIGFAPLRQTLQREFAKEGIYTSADRIIITHGAQQAISLLLLAVFRRRAGKLLVEAPTYGLVLQMAASLGLETRGIERNRGGYDFRELEALFRSGLYPVFYVVPRHHNPTGYNLTEKDKLRVAELAAKHGVLVIEDDYLSDLGSRKGLLPIHYYDTRKTTAYIRSFSKTFMPGLRIGAAVLDETLFAAVASLKHLSDLNTSCLHQAALNLFITSGMFEKHIRKAKEAYAAKLSKAGAILQALSPASIVWHVPQHGIFIWVELPGQAEKIARALAAKGILVQPAAQYFPRHWTSNKHSPRPENCIRLCISSSSEHDIHRLAEVVDAVSG